MRNGGVASSRPSGNREPRTHPPMAIAMPWPIDSVSHRGVWKEPHILGANDSNQWSLIESNAFGPERNRLHWLRPWWVRPASAAHHAQRALRSSEVARWGWRDCARLLDAVPRGCKPANRLGDQFQQLCRLHAECTRQGNDVEQADITLAALDSPDVVAVQVRQLRQCFL